MATVIQSRSCALGTPLTASNAPTYAKGRAKTVCSTLTSEAKSFGYAKQALPSRLLVLGRLVDQEVERVRQGRPDDGEAVAAAAGRAGEVDDERAAEIPATARDSSPCGVFATESARSASGMPGTAASDDVERSPRASRRAGPPPFPPSSDHEPGARREVPDRLGDERALVRDDATRDLVSLRGEELGEQVAAACPPASRERRRRTR